MINAENKLKTKEFCGNYFFSADDPIPMMKKKNEQNKRVRALDDSFVKR